VNLLNPDYIHAVSQASASIKRAKEHLDAGRFRQAAEASRMAEMYCRDCAEINKREIEELAS